MTKMMLCVTLRQLYSMFIASDEEIEKYGLNEGLGKIVAWVAKTYGKKCWAI